MKQITLSQAGFERERIRTRKRVFLDQMNAVVPWGELVALIEPHRPQGGGPKGGRPPFPTEALLRIHFLQQWFSLSDLAMQEALHDVPLYCEFTGLDAGATRLPDESTILRFRHLLEEHQLAERILQTVNGQLEARGLMVKEGSAIDATLLAAPSSTKNSSGKRDPEMHQTKKGNQWHFGMKAHIGVDVDTGLVHTVVGTAANVNDVTQAHRLVRPEDKNVLGDAGYQGVERRDETQAIDTEWHIALRPGKRRQLDRGTLRGQWQERYEHLKASVRAKVEHAFRVLKCQFGHRKVRYRGLAKNTQQLHTLFALANLWLARKHLLGAAG